LPAWFGSKAREPQPWTFADDRGRQWGGDWTEGVAAQRHSGLASMLIGHGEDPVFVADHLATAFTLNIYASCSALLGTRGRLAISSGRSTATC
jgi:hypothetical protein